MNRRQSILACAVAAFSLPNFLRANESKPFPLTRIKAGEGLSFWTEIYDEADPEKKMIPLIHEADMAEGWIDQYVSDGCNLVFDGESFKFKRSYGSYAIRWRKPTEAEIEKSKEYASHMYAADPVGRRKVQRWNEEQSLNGVTIPKGCIRASSVEEANSLALLLLKSSFA